MQHDGCDVDSTRFDLIWKFYIYDQFIEHAWIGLKFYESFLIGCIMLAKVGLVVPGPIWSKINSKVRFRFVLVPYI